MKIQVQIEFWILDFLIFSADPPPFLDFFHFCDIFLLRLPLVKCWINLPKIMQALQFC